MTIDAVDLETLEKAWEAVDRGWEDPDTHKKFMTLCDGFGRLDIAGGHYRDTRESDPQRAPIADEQLEKIVSRAMQKLYTDREMNPPNSGKHIKIILGIVTAAFLIAVLAAFYTVMTNAGVSL